MLVDFSLSRDQVLAGRMGRGDRDAFAELYRTHSTAVYRFALYLTADETSAAEITQDVFVWFMEHAERFDATRGTLGAFLGGVARKMASKRRSFIRRMEVTHQPLADTMAAPEPARTSDERVEELRRAIAALPERYREVVGLCDLEGRDYEQAAAILECPVGTVRSRLHRARALLARKLMRKEELSCCRPVTTR